MKEILNNYCAASGQESNLDKSGVYLSGNACVDARSMVHACLEICPSDNAGIYLGMPAVWERSKHNTLIFLKEKIIKKLQSWRGKFLSQARREIMIKSVVSAIPSYVMNCFKLPNKTCKELDGLVARFWWGQHDHGGKMHWTAWSNLTKSKKCGGMGFRDFSCFNTSLLAKQAWRIIQCPDDPWVNVLKGLYFPRCDFLQAGKGSRASWIWSSILEGRDLLLKGLVWRVGDGKSIKVWDDKWIPVLDGCKLHSNNLGSASDVLLVEDILRNGRWWLDEIEPWISSEEMKAIKCILLPRIMKRDSLVWNMAKDGIYSVRSGYYTAKSAISSSRKSDKASSSALIEERDWGVIWNSACSPRIKNFLWRACSGALASKEALFRRKCSTSPMCHVCGIEVETIEHALLFCEWTQRIWLGCPVSLRISRLGVQNFHCWMSNLVRSNPSESDFISCCIGFTSWLIWKARCDFVFEDIAINPDDVCSKIQY